VYALRLQNSTDTAARTRIADLLGLNRGTDSLRARSGVRPGGGAVTVNAGTMDVVVAPLVAFIQGGVSAAQGGYPVVSDANVTLTVTAGHASLARIDTVIVEVRDNAYDGSGSVDARVRIVDGTPSGSPVAPALPTNAIALRNISVPAGTSVGTGGLTSGNLSTDRRQLLTSLGGIIPVAAQSERDGLTPYQGLAVYRMDTNRVEAYDGATWRPVSANEVGAWRIFGANNTWTNPLSYQTIPDATDRTALTTTLVKTSASTVLAVQMDTCLLFASGTTQVLYAGLKINGTNYDVTYRYTNANAPLRLDLHGSRRLTGIAAGTLTIEPVIQSSGASSVQVTAGADLMAYTVREVS
jgi:hypothetical protein